MAYRIQYTPAVLKQLSKLDKPIARKILDYMDTKADNPTGSGKSLKGNLKAYWRHRVGDYRVISYIDHDILTVLVINVGHRKKVYN